jgi:hypothetical protein
MGRCVKLITHLKKLIEGEIASRDYPNYYSKRKWETHLFLRNSIYLLGISKQTKSRVIVWPSGDISTFAWIV